MNVIWCLCDLRLENGATLQVPGSHRFKSRSELPPTIEQDLVPITAPRGSIVAMDGRLWHTSGANTTKGEDRPLLFAYHSKPFLRNQWNFSAALRREVEASHVPRHEIPLGTGLHTESPEQRAVDGASNRQVIGFSLASSSVAPTCHSGLLLGRIYGQRCEIRRRNPRGF